MNVTVFMTKDNANHHTFSKKSYPELCVFKMHKTRGSVSKAHFRILIEFSYFILAQLIPNYNMITRIIQPDF